MKNNGLFLLEQLIHFKENDLLMDIEDGHTNESTKYHVTELIIGVASYVNDIRYCSKPNCRCSPETSIKHHYEQIKKYLKGTTGCLYPIPTKYIEEIIKGVIE